eukprot:1149169-Pelagomonas_calceolata.AAC.4
MHYHKGDSPELMNYAMHCHRGDGPEPMNRVSCKLMNCHRGDGPEEARQCMISMHDSCEHVIKCMDGNTPECMCMNWHGWWPMKGTAMHGSINVTECKANSIHGCCGGTGEAQQCTGGGTGEA